jgi:hypothetical protein
MTCDKEDLFAIDSDEDEEEEELEEEDLFTAINEHPAFKRKNPPSACIFHCLFNCVASDSSDDELSATSLTVSSSLVPLPDRDLDFVPSKNMCGLCQCCSYCVRATDPFTHDQCKRLASEATKRVIPTQTQLKKMGLKGSKSRPPEFVEWTWPVGDNAKSKALKNLQSSMLYDPDLSSYGGSRIGTCVVCYGLLEVECKKSKAHHQI